MYYHLSTLLLIMGSCSSYLSSPEVVYVCMGKQLLLTCVNNGSFLEWNISATNYIGLKLISSRGRTDPLTVNYTTFTFTRESQQPLNVTMTIINASVDYRVVCQSVPAGDTNLLEKSVQIIRTNDIIMYLNATELPSIDLEESFGENNVTLTVTLDLERMYNISGIIYGVLFTSVSEQTKRIISDNNTNMQLTISYNSHYNLSTFSNLCGHELYSELMHIFYGNCGPPSSPQFGYISPYTSTLEGAEINVTCLDGSQENSTTQSTCEIEGRWSPDPAQLCTDFTESDKTTNPLRPHSDDTTSNVITVVTTISVTSFVLFSIIISGITGLMVNQIVSKLRSHKHEAPADEPPRSSNTPVNSPPLYESVFPMEFQEQDLELKENVAYEPLPSSLIHGNYTAATDPVYSNVF